MGGELKCHLDSESRKFPADKIRLWGHDNSDYAGCFDTGRCTSGYCICGDGQNVGQFADRYTAMIMWVWSLFGEVGLEA